MTSQTALPKSVILYQCKCSDREVFRTRVVGLGTERPLFQTVRRRLDDTGAVEEVVLSACMREALPRLLEKGVCRTEWQVACVTEALRLMDEAAQAREAEEAEALQSEQASAPAPCEEGPGLPETPPAGEPEGQPTPGDPVTAGPANGQSDAGGEGQPPSPGPPSAEFAYQETDPGGTQLTDGERRARARQFMGEVGRYITSEQPEGMPVGEWYRKVLQELRCTDWYEVLLDPRVRRGQWGHVWEAMGRAKVKVAGPVAP